VFRSTPAPVKPPVGAHTPFDLKYLSRTGPTLIAVRPGELLGHLGEQGKETVDYARRALGAAFAFLDGDLKTADAPAAADVEELLLAGRLTLTVGKDADGSGTLGVESLNAGVVRTKKAFDWAGRVTKWFPKAEKAEHAGRAYYRVPAGAGKPPALCLLAADDRTLAFDVDEKRMTDLLDRLKKDQKPVAPAGWDEVARDAVALAHDTAADGWLTAPETPERAIDRALVTLGRKTTGLAVGFSAGDRTTVRVVITAADAAAARDVRPALEAVVGRLADEADLGPAAKLFARAAVTRDGKMVRAHGTLPENLLRKLAVPPADR
ncbi:MAG: hypothetical protein K2V38_01215, partial [Gemmataceae bacterium]|nr:hypothetical protein [Gemmataceae bacterium]